MRKLQTILYYLFHVVILSYFAAAIYCKDFGIIMHNKAVILTLFFVWSALLRGVFIRRRRDKNKKKFLSRF